MDIIARPSGGYNLVGRPQARAAWYPAATETPVQCKVWWRFVGEPARAARYLGTFGIGHQITVPYNPLSDRDVIISTISISATGVPSARSIDDALETTVTFQRETAAPTVTEVRQLSVLSAHTRIALAIDGFSALAIKRRVRTADDAGMTVNVEEQETVVTNLGDVLPRVVYLDRSDSGTGTRTLYVRVSHSSGGDYGAESAAQAFTFADDGGTGSTSEAAEGDPFGQGRFDA